MEEFDLLGFIRKEICQNPNVVNPRKHKALNKITKDKYNQLLDFEALLLMKRLTFILKCIIKVNNILV